MALFNLFKKNKDPKVAYASSGKYVDKNSSRYELEMKAKSGKAMTAEEHEQLQRYRTRDVWDQVFRIAGVVTVLTIILLAVFIFLYPYSLFNVFPTSAGKGDVFWKMLGAWHVYVGQSDTWLGKLADSSGYVEMGRIYDCAFQSEKPFSYVDPATGESITTMIASGFDFKCGIYVIGSWTIVVVATIGFVAAVIGAAFILASNIKNLIGVIRHVSVKTGETFSNLGSTAKESYEEAVPEAKERKKRTPRKTKEEVKPAEEEPVVMEEDEDEAVVAKRVEELKEELKEEEVKEQPKVVPVTEAPKAAPKKTTSKFDNYSDSDIDRLLGGK